jgi:hypothetical protein
VLERPPVHASKYEQTDDRMSPNIQNEATLDLAEAAGMGFEDGGGGGRVG